MKFEFLQPEEYIINTRLIKKGDKYLVKDGKDMLPFLIEIVDDTPNAVCIVELRDKCDKTQWYERWMVNQQYELVDILKEEIPYLKA